MKRAKFIRLRLQRCVCLVATAVGGASCGSAEPLGGANDNVHKAANAAEQYGDLDSADVGRQRPVWDEFIKAPRVENGRFVRGDDLSAEDVGFAGPEDALSPQLDGAEQDALRGQVAADVASIQALHVVDVQAATPACDESECIYFCDEDCLDVHPLDQAARVEILAVLTEEAIFAAEQVELGEDAWQNVDIANDSQVHADLEAITNLSVVEDVGFDDATDECPSCYEFTIDSMNLQRKTALHILAAAAAVELGPDPLE